MVNFGKTYFFYVTFLLFTICFLKLSLVYFIIIYIFAKKKYINGLPAKVTADRRPLHTNAEKAYC